MLNCALVAAVAFTHQVSSGSSGALVPDIFTTISLYNKSFRHKVYTVPLKYGMFTATFAKDTFDKVCATVIAYPILRVKCYFFTNFIFTMTPEQTLYLKLYAPQFQLIHLKYASNCLNCFQTCSS